MEASALQEQQHAPGLVDRRRIEDFIYMETRLLDERRFEEWQELFDEDAIYWVPTQLDQKSGLTDVSIFYDDKDLMRTRVERLSHPRIHVDDPKTRAVRLINNMEVSPAEAGAAYDIRVQAVLCAIVYWQRKQYVYGGRCEYQLRDRDSQLSIYHKRVNLVNCDGLLPPLVVPF
ncbi:aromatic-ring-hydroxylating dioxygenase subunit beta [Pseudomonas wenzhouensis]|nr:aromatic-ring-hydroxylating dioxygenase subunit beta [Pseudomonas wenzhouensis]MDM9653248.1 aromatic-ring-hydroxylating dioxygenase subunit beta [Pseudomonas wenzhouensis]